MCTRRSRYKIESLFSMMRRKLFKSYRGRAGCIIIKKDLQGKLLVLLIQALNVKKNRVLYKLPAGGIEKGETQEQAAARETEEEAGARGQIAEYIGDDTCNKRMTKSYFYLMDDGFSLLPPDQYEEGLAGRDRKWYTEQDALAMVPGDQKNILVKGLEIYKKKHRITI